MPFTTSAYMPFGPDLSVLNNVKLCKNCKHFIKAQCPPKIDKCGLFGVINLIDGTIEYKYALHTRNSDCKGEYYSEVSSSESSMTLN